jgi:hypothetical protein
MMFLTNADRQLGELSGCQNDVKNMMDYIKEVHGFQDSEITLLLVSGKCY